VSQHLKYSPGFHASLIAQFQSKYIHQGRINTYPNGFETTTGQGSLSLAQRLASGIQKGPMQYYKNKDLCAECI